MAAANTMDAIKKKMNSMKTEKEAALDKADQLDQQLKDQIEKNQKVGCQNAKQNVFSSQNPYLNIMA